MQTSVKSVNLHLSQSASIPKIDIWSGLHRNAFQFLLDFLSFQEIARCSLVCKNWNKLAKNPLNGNRFLQAAGLEQKENESWIRTYSIWLNSNFLIFLDKSNSMKRLQASGGETWRLEEAIDRVKEIASRLEPVITRKGIQLTSFADMSTTRWIRNIRTSTAFLDANNHLGSRSELKHAFERTMNYYVSKGRKTAGLPTIVYVVSDMDLDISLIDLKVISTNGSFNFIQVGNCPKGSQRIQNLQAEYNSLKAPQLDEEEKPVRKQRVKKKTQPEKRAPEIELVFENIKEKKTKVVPAEN